MRNGHGLRPGYIGAPRVGATLYRERGRTVASSPHLTETPGGLTPTPAAYTLLCGSADTQMWRVYDVRSSYRDSSRAGWSESERLGRAREKGGRSTDISAVSE